LIEKPATETMKREKGGEKPARTASIKQHHKLISTCYPSHEFGI